MRERFAATFARLQEQARASGREMVQSEVMSNTGRALEASEYAREQGEHEQFHEVVFRKLFGEGQDIGNWEVLRAAAIEVGLDAEEMQQRVDTGMYRLAVQEQTRRAQSLGLSGVPTFVFDDTYAVVGAQPFAAFEQVMAHLGQAPRS